MPITLADLAKRTKKSTVDYDGLTFEIEYKSDWLTKEAEMKLQAIREENALTIPPMQELVIDALVDWDVFTDKDKKKKAPIRQTIESNGIEFLTAIFNTMNEGASPEKKS